MRLLTALPLAVLCSFPALAEEEIGAGPHPLDGTIWDIASAERIDREALASHLARADIVVLGEIHDNAAQHLAQAWLVGRLRPAGIAFEMIPEAKEAAIEALLADGGAPEEIGESIGWDRDGWGDWALYRPIFEASSARRYTGGGVGRDLLMRAGAEGAASVVPDARFAPFLSDPLDPDTRAALEDEMIAAHCNKLPREAAAGMVEVQRLRDASFAAATLRAHEAGGPTVLVTGNGHARTDRGVPAYLAAVAPELETASVGLIETGPEGQALADHDLPFDFVWFTAPAQRPDPCASFGG